MAGIRQFLIIIAGYSLIFCSSQSKDAGVKTVSQTKMGNVQQLER